MEAPETIAHGTVDDIKDKMEKLLPNSWRLEGNRLIGETSMGTLVNMLPTDVILVGEKDGKPIFRKVDIQ